MKILLESEPGGSKTELKDLTDQQLISVRDRAQAQIDAKQAKAGKNETFVIDDNENGVIINKKENWYETLFDLFSTHGLVLTQTEISDIIHEVHQVSKQTPKANSADTPAMDQSVICMLKNYNPSYKELIKINEWVDSEFRKSHQRSNS